MLGCQLCNLALVGYRDGALSEVFGDDDLESSMKSMKLFEDTMKSNEQCLKKVKSNLTKEVIRLKQKQEKEKKDAEKKRKARERKEALETAIGDGEEEDGDAIGIERVFLGRGVSK